MYYRIDFLGYYVDGRESGGDDDNDDDDDDDNYDDEGKGTT